VLTQYGWRQAAENSARETPWRQPRRFDGSVTVRDFGDQARLLGYLIRDGYAGG